jgi:hypothetical protein
MRRSDPRAVVIHSSVVDHLLQVVVGEDPGGQRLPVPAMTAFFAALRRCVTCGPRRTRRLSASASADAAWMWSHAVDDESLATRAAFLIALGGNARGR